MCLPRALLHSPFSILIILIILIPSSEMLALLLAATCAIAHGYFTPSIVPVEGYTQIKSSNSSTAYLINAPTSDYGIPVYLIDLHGRCARVFLIFPAFSVHVYAV